MYQNFRQNTFQNQAITPNVNSQYQGLNNKYQPIGYVQSNYNQSSIPSFTNQYQNTTQYSAFQSQSPQSFHTANYRGNQPGHDAYLRSDSSQPAQYQYGGASYSNQAQSSYGTQQFSQQSPQSFHTANYRGDQPGHDAYLRSDSMQPAQSQYGLGASSFNSYNSGMNNSNQFGYAQQTQGYAQSQSPQSFHTASYRGNQPGHDNYLRSDSTQPAQSQIGMSNASFNRYQF